MAGNVANMYETYLESAKYNTIILKHYTDVAEKGAPNPSRHGFHHGPIPSARLSAMDNWYVHTASLSPNNLINPKTIPPQIPGLRRDDQAIMSLFSGKICRIAVSRFEMCGRKFPRWSDLSVHAFVDHRGALDVNSTTELMADECQAGTEALIYWILRGKWAKAKYVNDPGDGGPIMAGLCDRIEAIAAQVEEFADKWGKTFHRPGVARRESDGMRVGSPAEFIILREEDFPDVADNLEGVEGYEPSEAETVIATSMEDEDERMGGWPSNQTDL